MDYSELKKVFQELKRTSPNEDLTAHVIFTEDSFDRPYPLLSRTYCLSSDNKAFWSRMSDRSTLGCFWYSECSIVIDLLSIRKSAAEIAGSDGDGGVYMDVGSKFDIGVLTTLTHEIYHLARADPFLGFDEGSRSAFCVSSRLNI